MANVSHAVLAKSDQLNFDDFGGIKRVITVISVTVTMSEQPVSIFYDGHNGKPWKPSKGMIRLLCEAYGEESDNWIGKSIELYGDETVKWAGKEIGGIRISALSDIDKAGLTAFIALSRGKRRKTTIPFLSVEPPKPNKDDQGWIDAITSGQAKLEEIQDTNYRNRINTFLQQGQ